MTGSPWNVAECWNCDALSPWTRIDVKSVIHARVRAEGGPYRTFQCPRCRLDNGALPSPGGPECGWMLYPVDGLVPSGLLERLLPLRERQRLARARRWWGEHAVDVERFRRGIGDPPRSRRAAASTAPPPRPRPRVKPRPAPRRPEPPPRAGVRPAAASSGPRGVLGVSADAGLGEIRRAFRAAVKRWHPDRAPPDAAAQREAHRRFREARTAYEALLRQAGAD